MTPTEPKQEYVEVWRDERGWTFGNCPDQRFGNFFDDSAAAYSAANAAGFKVSLVQEPPATAEEIERRRKENQAMIDRSQAQILKTVERENRALKAGRIPFNFNRNIRVYLMPKGIEVARAFSHKVHNPESENPYIDIQLNTFIEQFGVHFGVGMATHCYTGFELIMERY